MIIWDRDKIRVMLEEDYDGDAVSEDHIDLFIETAEAWAFCEQAWADFCENPSGPGYPA